MSEEHGREREAGAYVAGELSGRGRRRFEAHLLECETCWHEVRLARDGCRVAESLRELAPPSLREDVRATIGLSVGSGRSTAWPIPVPVVAAAVAVTLAVIVVALVPSSASQPPPIAAALSVYRSTGLGREPAASGPSLAALGLQLRANADEPLATLPAREFFYDSPAGSVALFVSTRDFPLATGARERGGMSHGWTARDGELFMACGSRPFPYLLIGADPRLVARVDAAISSGSAPIAT